VIFKNLTILNLRHNNIHSMKLNQFLPELKILDLSSNNFCLSRELEFYQFQVYKDKTCLILANRNQCLMNNPRYNSTYKNYLCDTLSIFEYCVKKLDFSFLTIFDCNHEGTTSFLEEIKLNRCVQTSLKYLNLSSCNVTTLRLNNFLNNNNKLLSLKSLCLKSNNLGDDFLDNMLNNQTFKSLENLEQVDLTENNISKISSFDTVFKIFSEKNHVKKIKLSFNEIEILFNNYILIINNCSEVNDDSDLLAFKKFLFHIKLITKKSVNIIFSKRYQENVQLYLKTKQLDKIFLFE